MGIIANDDDTRLNAVEHLKAVLEEDANFSLAHLYLGKLYMSNEIEDFLTALIHMEKALKVWPKNLNLIYDSCRAEVANDDSKRLKGILTLTLSVKIFSRQGIVFQKF